MIRFTSHTSSLRRVSAIAAASLLAACTTTSRQEMASTPQAVAPKKTNFYPSTYKAPASEPTLIRDATVLIGNGERIERGDVLIVNGRIEAVGQDVSAPAGA